MLIDKYDFTKLEPEILEFWKKNNLYQKAKEKNKGKKLYYFLDGPPYANGQVHIGTAWNKALKDMVLRYKRMRGFDVWDRAGYDMHGLPIENAVQKKMGIVSKDDIYKIGIDKFTTACKDFAVEHMIKMNKDFQRMGVWMNFENAYQTISPEVFEGEWWLIKKAHENGRLYEGKKTMPWCPTCASANAKHELEYKEVSDESIFLKFKIKNKKNEYLIIWTTTPWTIPFNLGVMVNPEIIYVRMKVGDEVWITAKQLSGAIVHSFTKHKLEILEEFPGEKLKGIAYEHPFEEELKQSFDKLREKSKKIHTVVMSSEYVDTSAGSGLVHMAPGCGPEDYEVGHREGIPPYNELDEQGYFSKEMGKFAGWRAKDDDMKFIDELKKKGVLIATTPIQHDYPLCWRCKSPVVFRTTKQWFFKIEDLKEKMIQLNNDIQWVPKAAFNAYDSWLKNLRDNSISKQRFWGCPVPIWRCKKCHEYDVIGSIDELKSKAGKLPEDLHKPFIDEIKYKCKCGGTKERIPDVLDVWIDAGTTSWTCLDYPKRKDLFNKLFPPDFILEGKDQIRGWFNMLFVASMVSMEKPSFKSVYMHGFVNDAQGRKQSKSLGNYILPYEVIDKYGADTMRNYMIGAALPGVDMNYNFADVELKFKNLNIFWNIHRFIIDLAKNSGMKPEQKFKDLGLEEKFILSRLHSTIKEMTEKFDSYLINEPPKLAEDLYLDLSRNYIQYVRDKVSMGTEEEKQVVLNVCFETYMTILKLLAPIVPFITEKIYQNMKEAFDLKEESIHLFDWPNYNEKFIDKQLEESMEIMHTAMQSILFCREKCQLGVRWPLKEAVIIIENDEARKALESVSNTLKSYVNVKDLKIVKDFKLSKKVKPDYKKLEPLYGELSPQIIAKLAIESPESILQKIEKNGSYDFKINDTTVNILKDYLIIENEYPKNYEGVEFKYGTILLNKTRTPELENEGFAREVCRRVQILRKKVGLQKTDLIDLEIITKGNISLKGFEDMIKDRVGAKSVKIVSEVKGKGVVETIKVKEAEIIIGFTKI